MERTFEKRQDFGRYERPSLIKSSEEFNALAADIKASKNKWLDTIMILIEKYYENDSGCLHSCLEDENLNDFSLTWANGFADGINDQVAVDITHLMKFMTMEQRELIATRVSELNIV